MKPVNNDEGPPEIYSTFSDEEIESLLAALIEDMAQVIRSAAELSAIKAERPRIRAAGQAVADSLARGRKGE